MSFVCALSNEVPQEPVYNRASGHVYERRLIEKYIRENGKDPVTGGECTVEDLQDIKATTPVRPRPPQATSMPALLKMQQDEWDAIMLETFMLKKQLHTTRQELAHALYQHDAACRVIARLTKERDAARSALQNVTLNAAATAVPPEPMEGVERVPEAPVAGIPADALDNMIVKAQELSSKRKKRQKPDDLFSREKVSAFAQSASYTGLHSASTPGITCLALHPLYGNLVLTGGMDKKAALFDRQAEQVVATYKGHTKRITDVVLHPTRDVAITSSADATVRVWNTSDASAPLSTYTKHTKDVQSLALHPTGDCLVTSSLDATWALSDLATGRTFLQVDDPNKLAINTAQIHPDGLLLGTGGAGRTVYIWDIKEAKSVAEFVGHTGTVNNMAFSENGYYMATTAEDNTVRLWDLRMKKVLNFKTFEYEGSYGPRAVAFDYSGTYMAVAGKDVRVYVVKQWDELCVLDSNTAPVTDVAWGPSAHYLASTSLDRHLSYYSAQ